MATNMVQERWWHRLLKVGLLLVNVLVVVVSLATAYDSSKEYKHYYSWRPGGIPPELIGPGESCSATTYPAIEDGSISSCGTFYKPSEFLDELVASKRIQRSSIPSPRSELSDAYTAQALFNTGDYRHVGRLEWSPERAVTAFFGAVVAVFVCLLVSLVFFKLVLYIAHGSGARLGPSH